MICTLLGLFLMFPENAFALDRAPDAIPMTESAPTSVESKETSDSPFQWGGSYKGEVVSNVSGGARQGTTYLGLLNLNAFLDTEQVSDWRGGHMYLQLLGIHGKDPSVYVGDLQITSNIEAPVDTLKVYEAWVQQQIASELLTIRAGLYDLNTEFYYTPSSLLFLNSSLGIGKELSQTGNGPSIFPTTSLAVRARAETEDGFYVQTAVLDAVSGDIHRPYGTHIRLSSAEGALSVTEAGFWQEDDLKPTRKYTLGFWTYTKKQDHLLDVDALGQPKQVLNQGWYVLADHQVSPSLAVFARAGLASSDVNAVRANGSLSALINKTWGLAVSTVRQSASYLQLQESAGESGGVEETTFEATYRAQIHETFSLQPDVQYVVHPGANSRLDAALVFGLRFELGF